jgi:hypothetical protein
MNTTNFLSTQGVSASYVTDSYQPSGNFTDKMHDKRHTAAEPGVGSSALSKMDKYLAAKARHRKGQPQVQSGEFLSFGNPAISQPVPTGSKGSASRLAAYFDKKRSRDNSAETNLGDTNLGATVSPDLARNPANVDAPSTIKEQTINSLDKLDSRLDKIINDMMVRHCRKKSAGPIISPTNRFGTSAKATSPSSHSKVHTYYSMPKKANDKSKMNVYHKQMHKPHAGPAGRETDVTYPDQEEMVRRKMLSPGYAAGVNDKEHVEHAAKDLNMKDEGRRISTLGPTACDENRNAEVQQVPESRDHDSQSGLQTPATTSALPLRKHKTDINVSFDKDDDALPEMSESLLFDGIDDIQDELKTPHYAMMREAEGYQEASMGVESANQD